MLISSPSNPRLKHALALRERKQRERDGQMLVEGVEELALAVQSGARLATLLVCEELVPNQPRAREVLAIARERTRETLEVTRSAFEKIAYRNDPSGVLGIFARPDTSLAQLDPGPAPLILLIESVEKPGNLGAMLRTADAVGASAVISCDPLTDLTNPNVVRASKGALFSVPIAECTNAEAAEWLGRAGVRIAAATPAAGLAHTQADLSGALAIAVGEEKDGLSQFWLKRADLLVAIPMRGIVNSLNVSIAAALLLYEADRQRSRR